MSADNVIFVLNLKKKEYKVVYTHAPDNLWWNHIVGMTDSPVCARIVEVFSKARAFNTKEDAIKWAYKLYTENEYIEYGIQHIYVDKTWREVLEQARDEIIKEKAHILSSPMSDQTKNVVIEELNHTYSNLLTQLVKRKNKTDDK